MPRYDTHLQGTARRKRATKVRWARLLMPPGVGLVLLLLLWAFFRSSLLAVADVRVAGAAHVDAQQVLDAAHAAHTGFFRRVLTSAHLFGWPASLPPEAVALVPGAKSIAVSRSFFSGTVLLTVTERDPVGVWCFEATGVPVCQWFDEEGVVYGRAFVSEGSLVPVVHDRSQEKAGEGRRVLPGDELTRFLAITTILRSRGVSPRVVQVAPAGKQEVSMTTYNGPELRFTLRQDPDQVPAVLDDLLKRGEFNGLQYVDFRSAKRAFYQ